MTPTAAVSQLEPLAVAPRPEFARPSLSARYFGSFQVSIDHRPVPLGRSRRTRTLLAFIIDRGSRPIPRDMLMDVFWPDSPPDAARNSLHVAMCGLRKALAHSWPGTVIERHGETYRLSGDLEIWNDVAEFERRCDLAAAAEASGHTQEAICEYEAALALYGGDFLADDPYLDWALERREELRLRAVTCAERLGELHLEQGDLREALAVCTRVLREERCHEPVARRLMIAYARLGQPHMALRQYRRIVDVLHQELGVAPASETIALADAVRRRAVI
jgi:DNA-binding SARP family transcriptional activator